MKARRDGYLNVSNQLLKGRVAKNIGSDHHVLENGQKSSFHKLYLVVILKEKL